MGDRLTQTVNGTTTQFTLDLNSGLTQDGTNSYLYGNGRIAQLTPTQAGYFLGDALGSVRQLADGSGLVTLDKNYQPYGAELSSSGGGAMSYGELVYQRARYYQNVRFISRDI